MSANKELLGQMFFMNEAEGTVLLVMGIVAIVLTIVAVALIIIIAILAKRRKAAPVRELSDLTVDASNAACDFTVGGTFGCDGLQIVANYTLEPKAEIVEEYKVVTEAELAQLEFSGVANDCYVVKPSLSAVGKDIVTVKYKGKVAYYTVSVSEAYETAAKAVDEEAAEAAEAIGAEATEAAEQLPAAAVANGVRYNKSFTAKLIQSSDEVKEWYARLKNELLSYKKVKARMSWKRESFRIGRKVAARFHFRGNKLCIYLPLDPAVYDGSKYKVEDASDCIAYADTPCMYRLRNERRTRYAAELIASLMGEWDVRRVEREAEDYSLPYEDNDALIEKGLIKCEKAQGSSGMFVSQPPAAAEEPAEEIAEEVAAEVADEEVAAKEAIEVTEIPDEPAEEVVAEEVVEESTIAPVAESADESAAAEVTETAEEETAEEETPVDETEETAFEEKEEEETEEEVAAEVTEEPVEEEAADESAIEPAEETAEEETPVEESAEEEVADEPAAEEVTETPDGPTDEPAEVTEEEPVVKETEEPAFEEKEEEETEEAEVEELSEQEMEDAQSYKEEERDEDGIEVVGVMFRRRGKKVYWFDPDGKTWEKGEIALYKSPDKPQQEVIVVDNAKLSPTKLHLPLKPLHKATVRSQSKKS